MRKQMCFTSVPKRTKQVVNSPFYYIYILYNTATDCFYNININCLVKCDGRVLN